MASANKITIDGAEYVRVTDTSLGRRLQYAVKIGKFTARQWLNAHGEVMQAMEPQKRQTITSKELKKTVLAWLSAPKEARMSAKLAGMKTSGIEANAEMGIKAVVGSYMSEYCQPELNSPDAIGKAKRQCDLLLSFFEKKSVAYYSQMKRDLIKLYPAWRKDCRMGSREKTASADTVNQELRRLGAIIRHGVKYCGWQEWYLLEGIKVKATPENTKSVRPFEMPEAKAIMEWLRGYAEKTDNWYLHDMALLALCAGLEAKALTMLKREWFKLDLGVLRVYDKLVSGVIDAKTQNRARDIPLTPTLRKICERGFAFKRPCKFAGAHTAIHNYSRKIFARCEKETGIADVDWHRFRHTCATARLSAGWQLVRVSRMLGHSNVNTTASHYAEYDLSASPAGFEGMLKAYGDFVRWLDEGYFG